MKDLLKRSSLLRMTVVIVVMVFMAGQVTVTKAGGWGRGTFGGGHHSGQKDCQDCPDAWDKLLTTDRFELVMNDGAVKDKETCLVWERFPGTYTETWTNTLKYCFEKEVGGRKGWRMPTIEELASIIDMTQPAPKIPADLKELILYVPDTRYYYSMTTKAWLDGGLDDALIVDFGDGTVTEASKEEEFNVWCVRGGQGHDAPTRAGGS